MNYSRATKYRGNHEISWLQTKHTSCLALAWIMLYRRALDTFVILALIALVASFVTGALGYGFSSITVPLALLFLSSKQLNPALVVIELGVNGFAVYLNRHAIRAILPRAFPIVIGILPGVAIGSFLLSILDPKLVKLICYSLMLPLILTQAAGIRWPIRRERIAAVPFGMAVGTLYSLTTISGPPLALFFNNQGMSKRDFKVALAVTRVSESALTFIAYMALGLFTPSTGQLSLSILPAVVIGMPLGHLVIERVSAETFRRVCMSFDAWIVAFGLSRLVADLGFVPPVLAYQVLVVTGFIDALLLRKYFTQEQRSSAIEGV